MVAPIRYLSRRIQEQKIGILQNTEEEKVLEVVGRVGIGTTIFDAEYNLDVRGTANVSGILSVGQIISGAGNTFSDLTVTGDTDLQSDVIIGGGLTVTGVSTFQSAALFADGTEAEPSISFINDTDLGLYRPADNEIAFTNGGSESVRITSSGDVGIGTDNPSAKLDVSGDAVISNTGASPLDLYKYGSNAPTIKMYGANGNATSPSQTLDGDVIGGWNAFGYGPSGWAGGPSVRITAVATENNGTTINRGADIKFETVVNGGVTIQERMRLTNAGNLGIGTTNPSQKLDVNGNVNIRGELHGPEVFIIDPEAVGDNTGAVRIKGDLYVDGTEFIVDSENILLADYRVGIATTVATNLLLDGAGISIGATNIEKTFTYNNTVNTLESSIGLGVTEGGEFKTGTDSVLNRTTLGPTVVNSSLTNLGTLTELNVSGVSTFTGAIDANGDLDVDGHTELDDLNVSGVSTFSNTVDINATAEIDTLNVSLLSNFSGDVDVNASLDIQDNLTVTGLSSFFSNVDITGDLDVDGHTELDDLNVSGVSTFAGTADFNGDIDVDGSTELDDLNVSGVSTFAGDISIADKITHIGDTDTAIRFPFEDTFAVDTAGTERIRVSAAGSFSVGTAGAISLFHIYGGAATATFESTTNTSNLDIINTSQTTRLAASNTDFVLTHAGSQRLYVSSDGDFYLNRQTQLTDAKISIGADAGEALIAAQMGTTTGISTVLQTYNGSGQITSNISVDNANRSLILKGSNTEGIRITSAGDVGIATDNPSEKLQVDGNILSKNTYPSVYVNHDGTTLGGIRADATTKLEFKTITTAPLSFQVNLDEKMRIQNNGNVGIGTVNPQALLHVSSDVPAIRFSETDQPVDKKNWDITSLAGNLEFRALNDAGSAANRFLSVGRGSTYSISALKFFTGSDEERMRITSAGDVGIGTDNPTTLLDIRSAANVSNFLTLGADRNGANTEVGILFKDRNVVAGIQTAARINSLREGGLSNFSLIFSTSASSADATEKLRITSSGDVGIGTDAPSQLLDVNGDVRFRDKIFDSTGDSGVANYVLASGGPGAPWSWKLLADVGAGNLDAIFVRQDGSDVGAGGTNTTLDFYENFSLTQPSAGIASIRLSDDINISGILTVGQLNINDTAGISTVISYDAVDQQRELQNIVIDCGTY